MAIHRILVPIDFSPDSLHALTYARDVAQRVGAELLLLCVMEPIYYGAVMDFSEDLWRTSNAQLDRIATDLKKRGQRVRTRVQRGAPSQVIVDAAKNTGTDLIVMGTHGRTGLAHMLIGSVAERVVRTAHCPVLTVRRARRKPRSSRK